MTYINAPLPYYISPEFTNFTKQSGAKIEHYFFTRHGPDVSKEKKQTLIAQQIGLDPAHLISVHQIHSSNIAIIDSQNYNEKICADAMVSKTVGLGLAIITADCTPILLADATANIIGAIHAGWRSALDGIIEKTIATMIKLGAKREDIVAIIGPTILQTNYEVGAEFKDKFLQKTNVNSRYFLPKADKYLFDLEGYNLDSLQTAGIKSWSLHLCTYKHAEVFHSYRRASQLGAATTGRQFSIIALK